MPKLSDFGYPYKSKKIHAKLWNAHHCQWFPLCNPTQRGLKNHILNLDGEEVTCAHCKKWASDRMAIEQIRLGISPKESELLEKNRKQSEEIVVLLQRVEEQQRQISIYKTKLRMENE